MSTERPPADMTNNLTNIRLPHELIPPFQDLVDSYIPLRVLPLLILFNIAY